MGEAANLASAADSLAEGDYLGAALSVAGEVPGLGEIATGAKIVRAANRIRKAEKAIKAAEEIARAAKGPTEAFDRMKHYGRTPTTAQKKAVDKGMLFDHDPPLAQHYYEGDGKGGKPGYQMTREQRREYATAITSTPSW